MRWQAAPHAREVYLAPAPARVRSLRWDDWAGYILAGMEPIGADDWLPRSPMLQLTRQGCVEADLLDHLHHQGSTPGAQSLVLESATGAVVGWCHLGPSHATHCDAWLLDLNALPGFQSQAPRLLEVIDWPDLPVMFTTTASDGALTEALRAHGFAQGAVLPSLVTQDGASRDLRLWLRRG
jgi:hypothetical protein